MALLPTAANVRHLRTEICRISCWAEVLDAETRIAQPASLSPHPHQPAKMTPTLTLTREENDTTDPSEGGDRSGRGSFTSSRKSEGGSGTSLLSVEVDKDKKDVRVEGVVRV
jgi:hypothetical protein